MSNNYLRLFKIFLSISIIIFVSLILLIFYYSKPPKFDKKNFFTLSAKSPEYLIQPVNVRDLLIPSSINLLTVKLSPKNVFYSLSNLVNEMEIFKKKYDYLFFAGKKINEIIIWGNEFRWEKHLKDYSNLIIKQIKDDAKISDPRFQFNRLFLIYTNLLGHRQKLDELNFNSTKSDDEKRNTLILTDKIFDSLFRKIEQYIPAYQNAKIIYPLFEPLLDREYGFYEAQCVIDDLSVGNLRTIRVDGKNNYLYWDNHARVYPQSLKWKTKTDSANNQYYSSEIIFPNKDKVLAVINYYFDKGTLVSLNRIYQQNKQDTQFEKLFSEIIYPRSHLATIRKIIDSPQKNVENSIYEVTIYPPNQSLEEIEKALTKFSLVFFDLIEPEPNLLITKKSVSPEREPVFSLTKIGPFRYKLNIDRPSFFNGRQIRYNLDFGWGINSQRIISYFPGIITIRLFIIFSLSTAFYGLCLLYKYPLDTYIIKYFLNIYKLIRKFLSYWIFILKRISVRLRIWTLFFALLIIIYETFFHVSSSDFLVLISTILCVFTVIGYDLETRFNFILAFCFFVSFVLLILLNQELIADKLAIWVLVFFITGIIGTIIELTYKITLGRNIKSFCFAIIYDFRSTSLNRIIKRLFNQSINIYKPKSLKFVDLLEVVYKLLITILGTITVILSVIIIWLTISSTLKSYNKYTNRINQIPLIYKIEPKIVYPSTKFIVFGKSFGSIENRNSKLMSSYGELSPGFWTDSKITYSVPLEWKQGNVKIWVEKQIEVDGKKSVINSSVFELKIIPRGSIFTKDDDLFFEQLKTLDKETLKINGYD